jgi:hypothetical protein
MNAFAFALFWSIIACQGLRAVIDGPRDRQKETRRAEAIRIAGAINANRQMAQEHEKQVARDSVRSRLGGAPGLRLVPVR